jgi:hypothetical protein
MRGSELLLRKMDQALKLSGLLELLGQSVNDSLDLRKQRLSFHRHSLNGDIADTPFPLAVQSAKKLQILGYVGLVEHIQLHTGNAPRPHGWLEMGPHVPPHVGRNGFRFYDLSQNQSGSERAKGREGNRGQNTEQIPAQRFDVGGVATAFQVVPLSFGHFFIIEVR